jgi:hypothetical protein
MGPAGSLPSYVHPPAFPGVARPGFESAIPAVRRLGLGPNGVDVPRT